MGNGVLAAVAVLLVDNGKLLLGRRIRDSKFEGWQCPGGFMRSNETLCTAAQRCCLQKAGIQIDDVEQGPFTNNIFHSAVQHSISLYVIGREFKVINSSLYKDDQVEWSWFNIDELPSAKYQPLQQLLENNDLKLLLGL